MILLCLFRMTNYAFILTTPVKFFCLNCIAYGSSCLNHLRIYFLVFVIKGKCAFPVEFSASFCGRPSFIVFGRYSLSFFASLPLLVSLFARFLALFCLCVFGCIYRIARFTLISVFPKVTSWFNFVARITSFCYNRFRHDFFLLKKLCSRPFTSQSCAWSLLLYNINVRTQ